MLWLQKTLLEMNYKKLYLRRKMVLKALSEKPLLNLACADTTAVEWWPRAPGSRSTCTKHPTLFPLHETWRCFSSKIHCIRCPFPISVLVGAVWQAVGFKSICLRVIRLTNFNRKKDMYFHFLYLYSYFTTWGR